MDILPIKSEKKHRPATRIVTYILLVAVAGLLAFNQVSLASLATPGMGGKGLPATGQMAGQGGPAFAYSPAADPVQAAITAVLFTGKPAWSDGSVTYDDIEGSLEILANIDKAIPTDTLSPELKERYVAIGTKISCEYCCGAKAIIFADGKAACGCSHSYAMRGIAKYLLTQYGDSYSNEEILFEMTAWKNLFFPQATVQKAAALIANGMEITPDALNDPKLLEKVEAGNLGEIGQLGGMVGSC